MTFFDTTRPAGSSFRKTEHIDLTPGQTTIRILSNQEEAVKYSTHFVKGIYIKCLGEDCPVCKSNTKIFSENPDSFRTVPGYSARVDRFAVNVLDKTPVKICPACNTEIKKLGNNFPPVCTNTRCGQPILEVKEAPLNKIKVLAKGVTVADLLNGINESVLDEEGNKLGINNFDIVLYVTGTGKQQTVSPIPLADKREPAVYDPKDLFDLTKIAIELTPEEITDLQKGISLKDIFAARKANIPEEEVVAKVGEAVQLDIDSLLK